MRWYSMLAIYTLFWAFSVFLVLPWGVRTSAEMGEDHVPGTAESAPHHFSMLRIAIRTTIVATILFGVFIANYEFGWVDTNTFDFVQVGGTE